MLAAAWATERVLVFGVLAVFTLAGAEASGARGGTLDEELLRSTPVVFEYLRTHGVNAVGVLKFRVQRGDDPAGDQVGPLNLNLATRLELALVLKTDINKPVNIIRDADAVAARLPGADHLNPAGRRALFEGRYRLAWGDAVVGADAFLTGVARVSPDLHKVTVGIMGFDRKGVKLEPVVSFTASTDPPLLLELGESYLTRGLSVKGHVVKATEAIAASVAAVREKAQPPPLEDPSAPVRLVVEYDRQPVAVKWTGAGEAVISEPRQGQAVTLMLQKRDQTPTRYGVVLQVNGLNTLYKERTTPQGCSRWILSRDCPEIQVQGFYAEDQKTVEAFRIVSRKDPDAKRMHYGPDLGTIHMIVFREKAVGGPQRAADEDQGAAPGIGEEAEDMAVMNKASFPSARAKDLPTLRQNVYKAAGSRSAPRGLIVEGTRRDGAVRRVTFDTEPVPMMSARIRYLPSE
jgi:hypothetical protein